MRISSRHKRRESRRRALKAAAARVARRSGKPSDGGEPEPSSGSPPATCEKPIANGAAQTEALSTGQVVAWSLIAVFLLILVSVMFLFVFLVTFRG